MMTGRRAGLYRVKLDRRWTVAEHIIPDDESDAYWVVLGSLYEFANRDFAVIGNRIMMPPDDPFVVEV